MGEAWGRWTIRRWWLCGLEVSGVLVGCGAVVVVIFS
jgi:hypothetical protein